MSFRQAMLLTAALLIACLVIPGVIAFASLVLTLSVFDTAWSELLMAGSCLLGVLGYAVAILAWGSLVPTGPGLLQGAICITGVCAIFGGLLGLLILGIQFFLRFLYG